MLSIDILKWLSLFNASELSGAGREMSTLRVKSSQKRKFRSGCAKIVPNLRITPHKFFLDIWTPLLYNTREGGGIGKFHVFTTMRGVGAAKIISCVYYCVFGAHAVIKSQVG
jgi:hypothetical protein